MATITDLKAADDAAIRNQTTTNSVTRNGVTDRLAAYADELQARGMHIAATTGDLATIAGADTNKVYVPGIGVFQFSASGTANGITIFAASGTGFWVLKGVTEFYTNNKKNASFNSAGTLIFHRNGAFDQEFIKHTDINVNGGVHAIDFTNLSAGSSAGLGMAMRNDTGAFFQLQKGSSTYSIIPGGTLMRDSGGGFLFMVPNGTGKFYFSGAANITSGPYIVFDNTVADFKGVPIKTVAPSGAGAGSWKLGTNLGVDGVGAAAFIEIDVNGTLYVLTAKAKV